MKKFYNNKYKKNVIMLRVGEYYSSTNAVILHTILGSCIATCIFDTEKKIGGMNHYLLPGMIHSDEILTTELGRYGMYAMELLIGELVKFGAQREHLAAKIFGGGNVLKFRETDGNVTGSNINFAKKFLEFEKIPIINQDTGGDIGRKIMFFTDTGKVFLKKFDIINEPKYLNQENEYKSLIFHNRKVKPASVILF